MHCTQILHRQQEVLVPPPHPKTKCVSLSVKVVIKFQKLLNVEIGLKWYNYMHTMAKAIVLQFMYVLLTIQVPAFHSHA